MSSNTTYCYNSVSSQGCRNPSCRLRHDIHKCSCGLVLLPKNIQSHIKGNRHRENVKRQLSEGQAVQVITQPRRSQSLERCEKCSKDIPSSMFQSHVEGHQRRQRLKDVQAALTQAAADKNGITVSGKDGLIDFGIVEEEIAYTHEVSIVKTDKNVKVALSFFEIRSSQRNDNQHPPRFTVRLSGQARHLNRPRTLVVTFNPAYEGRYEDTLELVFFDITQSKRFVITRRILAVVGSRDDHEQLQPTAPYVRRQGAPFDTSGPVIPSLRPPTWTRTKWTDRLLEYKPPEDLIQAVYGPHVRSPKAALQALQKFKPSSFTPATYGRHFQLMLHLEEEKLRQELEMYALEDVELRPNYPRYELLVKGLAEGRPSVLVGDFISCRLTGSSTDQPWYQGRVHEVHQNHVSLRFDDKFSTYRGTKFDVLFTLNRLPYRRMHQVLTNSNNPARLLFPEPAHILNVSRLSRAQIDSIVPVNRLIGEDEEQLETVAVIVHQPRGSVPFVIFGPPGTGKSVTVVEAIRQLLMRDPGAKILVCAPSNSASDLLAQKLADLGPMALLRLNALSRKFVSSPKTLERFSRINDNKVFVIPPLEEIKKFSVIVSTCLTGGVPASLGLKRGHFTHIFIDEAGQATEPEIMVPIKSSAGPLTNVVLAGDNKQLGPIVHSDLAASLGLKLSYLARIMGRKIYDLTGESTQGGSGITIVKLVKNFRSHPSILQFANTEFYNGELQPCGDPALTRSLENSDELPTKKFPLIFHGIEGRDEREESSPSYFNIGEATIVRKYCSSLVANRKQRIKPEDIGIITPYHAQRWKIEQLLRKDPKLSGITVGSVEEFQGQERRVIIISTVRSSPGHVMADIRRSLGFVANARRFNVAITRAQALLILVGNPDTLGLDPLWRAFMAYIHTRGGWKGKKAESWDPNEPVCPGPEGFDGEMRARADGEATETMARLKALIAQKNDDSDFELGLSDDSDSDGHDEYAPGMRADAE